MMSLVAPVVVGLSGWCLVTGRPEVNVPLWTTLGLPGTGSYHGTRPSGKSSGWEPWRGARAGPRRRLVVPFPIGPRRGPRRPRWPSNLGQATAPTVVLWALRQVTWTRGPGPCSRGSNGVSAVKTVTRWRAAWNPSCSGRVFGPSFPAAATLAPLLVTGLRLRPGLGRVAIIVVIRGQHSPGSLFLFGQSGWWRGWPEDDVTVHPRRQLGALQLRGGGNAAPEPHLEAVKLRQSTAVNHHWLQVAPPPSQMAKLSSRSTFSHGVTFSWEKFFSMLSVNLLLAYFPSQHTFFACWANLCCGREIWQLFYELLQTCEVRGSQTK